MTITLNGVRDDGAPTLGDLLERHLGSRDPVGIAVAVDAEVVPRHRWAGCVLRDGAVVEIVTAVQGG
jgi:sulfur carrier protein